MESEKKVRGGIASDATPRGYGGGDHRDGRRGEPPRDEPAARGISGMLAGTVVVRDTGGAEVGLRGGGRSGVAREARERPEGTSHRAIEKESDRRRAEVGEPPGDAANGTTNERRNENDDDERRRGRALALQEAE